MPRYYFEDFHAGGEYEQQSLDIDFRQALQPMRTAADGSRFSGGGAVKGSACERLADGAQMPDAVSRRYEAGDGKARLAGIRQPQVAQAGSSPAHE